MHWLAGLANDRGAHQPKGRQQGQAEGRGSEQTKGRAPRTHQGRDKAVSLTPWKNVPSIRPQRATPNSCSLESYSGVGVTGIL